MYFNKGRKNEQKNIKYFLIGIIVITIIFVVIIYLLNKTENVKDKNLEVIQKANNIFGRDYCKTDHSFEIGGDALTKFECKLCGKSLVNSNTNVPKLCQNCANITERCYQCGNLKK